MRRFALIGLLGVLVSLIAIDGDETTPAAHAAFAGGNGRLLVRTTAFPWQLASVEPDGSGFRILGDGSNGSWSPDGRRIVFDTEGSTLDILIMDADGSNVAPILTGPTADRGPTWSPDGERIAFIRHMGGESTAVYTAKADGADILQLTDPNKIAILVAPPKWSPDGSKIIFGGQELGVQEGGGWDVYSVPAAGGGVTRLTNTSAAASPEWSPDGSKIAFTNRADIWVVGAGGGAGARIATPSAGTNVRELAWSPDGERIAYTEVSGFPYTFASYAMDANGGNKQAIPVSGIILDWQPVPGTKVEFTQAIQVLQSTSELQESLFAPRQPFAPSVAALGGNGKLLVGTNVVPYQLASVEPDGSDYGVLADGFFGSWSPDGKKIAFQTHDPFGPTCPTDEIWTMDADGSNVTKISTGAGMDLAPSWSPDGQWIAFWRDPCGPVMGKYEMVKVRADGTGMVQLTDWDVIRRSGSAPKWSPDGSRILFYGIEPSPGDFRAGPADAGARVTGTRAELYTVPAAGGALTRLTFDAGVDNSFPEWSPDGSKIAFGNDEGIWVMNAAGGVATKIAADAWAAPVWSPDGKKIAYSHGWPSVSSVIDPDGGNKQPLPVPGVVLDWQPVPPTKVEFTQAVQQLQSVSELIGDLKGDGKPPVPIIAGKPAAMRVLFDEVQQATTYDVEVSGQFNGSETVTLKPGCTLVQRRKQEAGCTSVDFYFTPPQGNWSITLRIREAGTMVEEHEFNLTSERRKGIVLKAVSVCDAKNPGLLGIWQCEDPGKLFPLITLLRKVAPTDSVAVQYTAEQVRHETSAYPAPDDWWDAVVEEIHAKYGIGDALTGALSGDEIYYFGMARPDVPGATNGMANDIPSRGAFSRSVAKASGLIVTPATVAHEVGHMLGREHSGVADPAAECWQSTAGLPREWPYADNALRSGPVPGVVEVGFDVASKKALPGDENFDLMGYCYERWISPFTYVNMMTAPGGLGPRVAGVSAPVPGTYWLVRGAIAAGGVEFRPLFAYETEGSAGAGSGPYRIEVQNGSGSPLFTRFFTPVMSHPDLPPGAQDEESDPFFGELIPVQAGAARIVVLDDSDAEIGSRTLGGAAPAVNITQAANDGDAVTLQWSVTDADSAEHTYWVDYSPDGGATWQNLAMGLADEALVLDVGTLAGSNNAVVRVIASDGVNSGQAVSGPFAVAGKPPHGEIIAPSGGSSREGSLVWLQAAAWDTDDGTLDGPAVTWSSSRDGSLGTGASLPVYGLSVGTHTITMTAKDSDNNTATDSIVVTVFDGPIIEGQVGLSGDVDCSGAVNSIDGLKLLRHVAGLNVDQPGDCPGIGTGGASIFGDVNCDVNVTAADALFVLRFVAALPANLPQGCRPVGT